MDKDMLAIPMTEIMTMVKRVEQDGKVAVEDCSLVVPKEGVDTKFYVVQNKDLPK